MRIILALTPSAYLASRHATEQLVSRLLPDWIYQFQDDIGDSALAVWLERGGIVVPSGQESGSQKTWDDGPQQFIHNFLRVLTLSTELVYWLLYRLVLVRGSTPFHAQI